MKHTRLVSTKCTPGFACRAFSDTTLVCFIVNEHTTKCSHYSVVSWWPGAFVHYWGHRHLQCWLTYYVLNHLNHISNITGVCSLKFRSLHYSDVSFDLRLNKRLSKQWRRRWFETPSRSLWRHCNTMRPRDVCVHRWIGSLLIWITACLLFAAKPPTGNYLKFTQNADDFLHEYVIEFIFWMVIVIFPVNLRSQKSIGSRHLPQGLQNISFKQKITRASSEEANTPEA